MSSLSSLYRSVRESSWAWSMTHILGNYNGAMTIPASSGSSTIEREQSEKLVEPGDHERYSHYAPKDKIMESMVTGTPLIALCGKVWVPTRDPNGSRSAPGAKRSTSRCPKDRRSRCPRNVSQKHQEHQGPPLLNNCHRPFPSAPHGERQGSGVPGRRRPSNSTSRSSRRTSSQSRPREPARARQVCGWPEGGWHDRWSIVGRWSR